MSEYQYYEFQAIDRPLSKQEMAEVRSLSTRATITSTRFVNVYNWGSFKGNPLTLVERYYDAFLYVANWGSRQLMLRLPKSPLDLEMASLYCVDDEAFSLHVTRDHVILTFDSETEEPEDWEEGDEWLPALIFLRADIAAGDLRSLYLGWLLCLQEGLFEDDFVEPPVPPGLKNLSGPLQALVEFLRIEDELLQVAAERSGTALKTVPSASDVLQWLDTISDAEKNELLVTLACGDEQLLQAEVRRRIRQASAVKGVTDTEAQRRTVGELVKAVDRKRQERRRQESEERARRQQERAAARAAYLDSISGRMEEIWQQVETLVETKQQNEYDEAVRLLTDLRDASVRKQKVQDFNACLLDLRAQNARKYSFIRRLDQANLNTD